jgi:hypothetical protein
MAAKIVLNVCTPEGRTWLALLTGVGGKFGFDRDFINAASKDLSRSGKTGSMTFYITDDGIYQSNEGRKRLGKTFYRIEGDTVTEITEDEAVAALTGGAS